VGGSGFSLPAAPTFCAQWVRPNMLLSIPSFLDAGSYRAPLALPLLLLFLLLFTVCRALSARARRGAYSSLHCGWICLGAFERRAPRRGTFSSVV